MRRSFRGAICRGIAVMSGAARGAAVRASWPQRVERGERGTEAATSRGANAVPEGNSRKSADGIIRERQLRGHRMRLSTFMLDANACDPRAPSWSDRASRSSAAVAGPVDLESFKYVCAIGVSHTNVWSHPIALCVAGVYLRRRDARRDAHVNHLQALPPLRSV